MNPKIPQTDLLESQSQADHKGSWVCVYMSTLVYKHTFEYSYTCVYTGVNTYWRA